MLSDGLWHKCSSRKRIVAVRFMVQSANTYTDTYNQCVCAVVPTNYRLSAVLHGLASTGTVLSVHE